MRAQIQRFSLMKDGWYGPATVDFSETSCCIITGQNGGGKTLTNRMIELVGKWTANPSRFNLREMEKLAQKTGIQRVNIVVRSTICKGRDKYINALPWASEFGFDPSHFSETNTGMSDDYDFAVDVAHLTETNLEFDSTTTIQRRQTLELHYMTRHHEHRSRDDQLGAEENPEDYSPTNYLRLEEHYGDEVFEHARSISTDWDDVTQGLGEELIIAQPRPTDEIHGKTLAELLGENGLLLQDSGPAGNAQPIHLPVPVLLNVRRHIENVAADLVDIRELDEELKDQAFLLQALEEGAALHNSMFNTETELSDYVLDARFGLPVEVDVGALQPFEHHHMTLSQPNYPAWLAFRRFLGYIPEGEYLSSGQLQLLAMTRAILGTEHNALLMIDEPELSLHIDWQRELIGFFRTTFPNHTFLISTHSPDILYHEVPLVIQIPPLEEEQ